MTTAYTSLLGLALPVTGELSGVWGDTVNNSITSLLDSAIAGTTTITSDADVTLTTTTGAANTSREAILLWTAGGTATRTITAPAQSKTYIVINKTSSTQSIKLVGVGPTSGVTIIAGESAVCAWNGLDFIKVSNISGAGVFSSITNTGLTSGRVVYSTTGGLETDSANLTFNGTTLTANTLNLTNALGTSYGGTGVTTSTGSGNNVLSTSPTLVTPILGTPTSGTLTNCTGLPNAGLVNSSVTVGSTAIALGATSTTLAGLTSVASNTLTSASATALTLQSAGTTAVYVDTSQNVGIGTTTIAGRLSLGSLVANRVLAVYDDATNWYGLGISAANFQVNSPSASSITFNGYTRSTDALTERMRIEDRKSVV